MVIDGLALGTLEALPAEVPEVKPGGRGRAAIIERQRVSQPLRSAWIWVLDRDAIQRHLEGGTTPTMVFDRIYKYEMAVPVPPWLRLETYWIHSLWFRRSRAMMTLEWDSKCQWDQKDSDTILWWSSNAQPRNQSNYARGVRQTERALRYDQ